MHGHSGLMGLLAYDLVGETVYVETGFVASDLGYCADQLVFYGLVGRRGFGDIDSEVKTATGFCGLALGHVYFLLIVLKDAALIFVEDIHAVTLVYQAASAKEIKKSRKSYPRPLRFSF